MAFSSDADNLGGPVNTATSNIYVRDRQRKRLALVSRASGGGAGGNGDSERPSISASGRRVAFETDADNLGGPIDPTATNVYAYDRKRKRVALVSRAGPGGGGAGGDEDSGNPSISADGRFVAFRSFAANLGGPTQTESNIYLHDRSRGTVRLVSRRSGAGGQGANAVSYQPSVSANGRYVAFDSEATNLGGPITPGVGNIYVYDRNLKRVALGSRQTGRRGAGGDRSSFDPDISPSGRYVAFAPQHGASIAPPT